MAIKKSAKSLADNSTKKDGPTHPKKSPRKRKSPVSTRPFRVTRGFAKNRRVKFWMDLLMTFEPVDQKACLEAISWRIPKDNGRNKTAEQALKSLLRNHVVVPMDAIVPALKKRSLGPRTINRLLMKK